jgi:pyruvate dehydrogenase E1 component
VSDGAYIRQHFFGADPEVLKMVEHLSDDVMENIRRGGHDPVKVYAAYHAAVNHKGAPTVILAKTVKGYGLGDAGEGQNVAHNQKKIAEDALKAFRTRFSIPVSDAEIGKIPFYKPDADSEEMKYLMQRRAALGGFVPERKPCAERLEVPGLDDKLFAAKPLLIGSEGGEGSTSGWFRSSLTKHVPSGWKTCSRSAGFTPARVSCTSRWITAKRSSTRKLVTGSCWKKESTKLVRWDPSLPQVLHTRILG